MSYPLSPDFTSAGPDVLNPPAWWGYTREDGTLNICETTGAAVVRRIRASLGLSNIAVWDTDLQNALIAKAQTFAASQPSSNWQPLIDDLNNGLAQQQPSKIATQFGIWLAYYQSNGLRLDAISIDNSVRLSAFGATIPDGPQGDVLVCLDPNRDVPVGNYNQNDLTSAEQQSSAGIRLHAGESMPVPQAPTPPSTGIPTPWLIGIGVGVLAVTAIVVYSNSQYASERNADLRRSSRRQSQSPVNQGPYRTAQMPSRTRSLRSRRVTR